MAYGVGVSGDQTFDPNDGSDQWGGPMNGIDLQGHAQVPGVSTKWHGNLSVDTYLFLIMMGALALLWLLGGVVFKNARM
jgi:hypothetical protein